MLCFFGIAGWKWCWAEDGPAATPSRVLVYFSLLYVVDLSEHRLGGVAPRAVALLARKVSTPTPDYACVPTMLLMRFSFTVAVDKEDNRQK